MRMSSTAIALCLAAPLLSSASASAQLGLRSFENAIVEADGSPATRAGSHPWQMTTSFALDTATDAGGTTIPDGDLKDVRVDLPAGLLGDPSATAKCTMQQFTTRLPEGSVSVESSLALSGASCPIASQVGTVALESSPGLNLYQPLYNLRAPPGVPAELGFNLVGIPIVLTTAVRTGGDYGLQVKLENINEGLHIYGSTVTVWGVPADRGHDPLRGECLGALGGSLGSCATETPPSPFLTLPTSCPVAALESAIHADSWQEPGRVVQAVSREHGEHGEPTHVRGCERLDFSPSLSIQPDTTAASSPTGLAVRLHVPQLEGVSSLAEAHLKEAVVTLPSGFAVSPSAANGLQACSPAQIALESAAAPACPDASKLGSVRIDTPLLEKPLEGGVYLAQQGANPFGSLLALYVVAEGSGVTVKLAGKVQADPATGQLTATFANNPQLPFGDLTLRFFSGPRAPLLTPAACGRYAASATLTPWSGSGPVAPAVQPFAIDSGCASTFAPSLTAGTASNQAGDFSSFVFSLARADSDQQLAAVSVTTPPGLLGMLSEVALCPEPQARLGECSPASQIGHVTVGAGPGPDPVYVPQLGRPQDPVYLTGPYRGAPFGLSIVVPAQAGPFDLGTVVVRAAVEIDPRTAQVTVLSDPLPRILQGIPLDLRSAIVTVDRPEFMFNPTDCAPLSVTATVASTLGAAANLSTPFRAANCARLAFKPRFTVSTSGRTSKRTGASLDVKLSFPSGPFGSEANVAKVKVSLPRQLPSQLKTLKEACPARVFDANPGGCPAGSIVGVAKASTPVLPVQLTGPVYFVSHGGEKFPDLVIVLQGDGVRVDLTGATFISRKGITSSTFKTVPDVPVQRFELYLPQGAHPALAANTNLCRVKGGLHMPTAFTAQDGAVIKQSTPITVTGCPRATAARRASKARQSTHSHNAHRSSR